MNLRVDVISDVICPWCYIGKRRLEKAIADFGKLVEVQWHPFQLNPAMPKKGISRREYRTRKFGSWERSQELDARVIAVGQEEGLDFAFDRIERTPNTLDPHRLIWLAGRGGVQDAVVEALFRAYFTEGRDIGDHKTLLDVTADAGLERNAIEAVLNGDDGVEAVRQSEDLSRQHHVASVPFFVVNGKFTLAGAQLPEEFLRAFGQAFDSKEQSENWQRRPWLYGPICRTVIAGLERKPFEPPTIKERVDEARQRMTERLRSRETTF